jgi:hypothetical protein
MPKWLLLQWCYFGILKSASSSEDDVMVLSALMARDCGMVIACLPKEFTI